LQDVELIQMDLTATNRRLLTVPKTAAYLGLSEYSVRKMVHQGQLPTRQVASRKMIPVALLREWLERHVDVDDPAAAQGESIV
jgi:excisionase family DNA binding protein